MGLLKYKPERFEEIEWKNGDKVILDTENHIAIYPDVFDKLSDIYKDSHNSTVREIKSYENLGLDFIYNKMENILVEDFVTMEDLVINPYPFLLFPPVKEEYKIFENLKTLYTIEARFDALKKVGRILFGEVTASDEEDKEIFDKYGKEFLKQVRIYKENKDK